MRKKNGTLAIDGSKVMNGFCYDYASALLARVKELNKKNQFWLDKDDNSVSLAAAPVILELSKQIFLDCHAPWIENEGGKGSGVCCMGNNLERVIEVCDAFLVIFKKK